MNIDIKKILSGARSHLKNGGIPKSQMSREKLIFIV